ncbi:MAG TPA: hypothetical protein PKE40_01325 [Arachnia sp.]|nr:hypothetical protein [Arachnia sp.]HMT84969.1 hypothetical protein [Arachnia sp.]
MQDWTPHRRDDGEQLGWIRPADDEWVPVDLLGRELSEPVDWIEAEELLDAHGLAYLAESWLLELEGGAAVRVRFVEVAPERIVVKGEDFGAIDIHTQVYELPWPLPAGLRPPTDADPSLYDL